MELEDLDVPTYTDEEARFLASLESDVATNDDSFAPDAANDDDLAMKGATGTALLVLNMVEGLTKQAVHKDFGWGDNEKQIAAEQIAPALVKNGGELPEWLQPYKEEMIALFAIGSLAFGGYMQVKELRRLEEAKQKVSQEKTEPEPASLMGDDDIAA